MTTLIHKKIDNLYYPELSYEITGLVFKTHNELGRFKLERQYCDVFEKLLIENKIKYYREKDLKKYLKIQNWQEIFQILLLRKK